MKRNVFLFGLVLGTILCINMVYMVHLCYSNTQFERNDIGGYAIMVLIFSLCFFGIRNYRNKELNGEISFGKAFKAGALIVFVGATLYVAIWMFYYYLFVPDFLDHYIPRALQESAKGGASVMEMEKKTKEMAQFREWYKNPFFIVLITYSEVVPVGLIVALVSALILKRKNKKESNLK